MTNYCFPESDPLDVLAKAIIGFGTIIIVIMILPIAILSVVVCCLSGSAHYRKRKKKQRKVHARSKVHQL